MSMFINYPSSYPSAALGELKPSCPVNVPAHWFYPSRRFSPSASRCALACNWHSVFLAWGGVADTRTHTLQATRGTKKNL